MKKLLYILLLFVMARNEAISQNKKLDSLLTLLKTDAADTNKVIHLNKLCWEYQLIGEYDKGITYGKQALALCDRHAELVSASDETETLKRVQGDAAKKGKANAYNNIGGIYYSQGNYPEALKNYFASLKIYEEIKNKKGIANSYHNIGNIYTQQGNYPEALKNYFASLKIYEEIKNKKGIANSYNNIGIIYYSQGNYPEALKNYFASLKMFEEIKDKRGIATSYNNMGIIYLSQGNYPEALKNYFASLKIREEIGDKDGIATSYINLGTLYTKLAAYPPLEGAGGGNPPSNSPKGETNKYLAQAYLDSALQLSTEIGSKDEIKETYAGLAVLDSVMGNYKAAFAHHKLFVIYRDSIDNEETRKKTIQSQMGYDYEKKEILAKAEQDKKDAIALEEKQKQQIVIYAVAGVLLLVVVFSLLLYKRFKLTNQQKHIIEEKNKDITDSITYALRIQQAKLPKKEEIYAALPQCFVLFKPKDIVSGDFYYFHQTILPLSPPLEGDSATAQGEVVFIAACDCTGHGVPGAFMSMIGSDKLEDAVSASADTSEILSLLNKGIKTALKQSEDDDSSTRDGMDIALCCIDTESRMVKYAGANRPFWLIRNGQTVVEEIKATKKAIGGFTEDTQHYDSHEIQLQQGDTFYLSTDGFADTFSGADSKKLTTKKFKQILLDIQKNTMQEQEQHLSNFIENWKAGTEQVDDILVIGIRV